MEQAREWASVMGVLENEKHELFAQALAKGETASKAYCMAGYRQNDGNAATLKKKVWKRVKEIKGRGVERAALKAALTVASLLEKLEEVYKLAVKVEQCAAATGAVREMGVLSGLRVERQEVSQRRTLVSELTDAEINHALATGEYPADFAQRAGADGDAQAAANGPGESDHVH
jgi:hypothetical protein